MGVCQISFYLDEFPSGLLDPPPCSSCFTIPLLTVVLALGPTARDEGVLLFSGPLGRCRTNIEGKSL